MTSIGNKRLHFMVQEAVETPEGVNGQTRSFTNILSVWGGLKTLERRASQPTHKLTLRWNEQIQPGMRLIGQGRIYNIITVQDMTGQKRELICDVEEVSE
jgi:SPP1 family predicted phage head-tail adaptor